MNFIQVLIFSKTKLLLMLFSFILIGNQIYLIAGDNTADLGRMTEAMKKEKVVPDVIDSVPRTVLQVKFENNDKAEQGNILTPTKVKKQPTVTWEADPGKFYMLIMTDPDAPRRSDPRYREWHHWLVGNIPGTNVNQGEVLTEYVPSAPPNGSGLHRYILLVYEQPRKLRFDETKISKNTGNNRGNFSTRKFAKKYHLGEPIAGNFFQAEWDNYVPQVYKQLSGK